MRGIVVSVALVIACGVRAPVTSQADPEQSAEEVRVDQGFEAVVQVDAEPGGKKFQGVWLEREGGARWVVAYRPEGWLVGFQGRKVQVTGETYAPEGQAIAATHFRVETLRVAEAGRGLGPLLAVGPERALVGEFKRRTVSRGAMNEGQQYLTFAAEGGATYLIEGASAEVREGVPVRIVARVVEPDWSYTARRGGDYIWVIKVEPA